jgi:hypothetical protein
MNLAVLVALIAGGFAITAAIIGGLMNLRSKRKPDQKIGFADTTSTVVETAPPGVNSASSSSSQKLGVELRDVDVPDQSYALDHPVVDVKFKNTGGQPAYLTRLTVEIKWAKSFKVLEDLLPYIDHSGPLMQEPSATYDVDLPDPSGAKGKRITVGISQVIGSGETDRINVRLKTKFDHSSTSVYSQPSATSVYVLTLEFLHENGKRKLTSRTVGVACPGNILYVPTVDGLKRNLQRFTVELQSLRARVDHEMERHQMQSIDWSNIDYLHALIPKDLPAIKGVNANFWNPNKAVDDYLTCALSICNELMESIAENMPDGLGRAVALARETAQSIPELRRNILV